MGIPKPRRGSAAVAAVFALLAGACGGGGAVLGADAEETNADSADGPSEDLAEADGTADADASDDASVPPPCPVWAAPSGDAARADGTPARPWIGVQSALDHRGTCETVHLMAAPGESYDGAAVLDLPAGAALVLEGEGSSAGLPRLRVAGEGLRVSGDGDFTLRNLAFRGEASAAGRCLTAVGRTLRLDRTVFEDCRAAEGGAASLFGVEVQVSRSRFTGNRADGPGGALLLDGRTESAVLRVVGCRFDGNRAADGGAVFVAAISPDTRVEGSLFVGNGASDSGSALAGFIGGGIVGNRFERNRGGVRGSAVAANVGWPGFEAAHNLFLENEAVNLVVSGSSCCSAAGALRLDSVYGAVHHNLFVRNRSIPDPEYGGTGPGAAQLTGGVLAVHHNTFVENGGFDTRAHLEATNPDLRNNLFVGAGAGLARESGGSCRADYNGYWRPADPPGAGEGCEVGAHDLFADPRFVTAGRDDYRLDPGSPAIDAGDPDPAFADPDGTPPDLGAFGGPGGDWLPLEEVDVP